MSVYVGVRSVAKKIDKLYVGDGAGIARAVQKAYVGDPRGVAELWYQRNSPLGSLAVGSSVFFAVDRVKVEWLVAHQGLPGDMYDASCNGTWLLCKDVYASKQWSSSVKNNYLSSNIRSYLDSTFFNSIDSSVSGLVKRVKIPYRGSSAVSGGASGLASKVFPLSAAEVNFKYSGRPDEGACLEYFKDCAATGADSTRVANYNGAPEAWWLRTPDTGTSNSAVLVLNTGAKGITNVATFHGVRPALVLPQDALVDGNRNVIGG